MRIKHASEVCIINSYTVYIIDTKLSVCKFYPPTKKQ